MRLGTRLGRLEKQARGGQTDLSVLTPSQRERVIRNRFINPQYEAVKSRLRWTENELIQRLRIAFEELGKFLMNNPDYFALDMPSHWLERIAVDLLVLDYLSEGVEKNFRPRLIEITYQIAEIENWDIPTAIPPIKERLIELFFESVIKVTKKGTNE
jgi:hypothetical protein